MASDDVPIRACDDMQDIDRVLLDKLGDILGGGVTGFRHAEHVVRSLRKEGFIVTRADGDGRPANYTGANDAAANALPRSESRGFEA